MLQKTLRLKTRLSGIHIISQIHRMLALVVASTALQSQLPMSFTLPLTRLVFKYLRPPTSLTTWVSTLYVRLTNSLECQDAILTWILTKLYNEAPPWTSWNYVLSLKHHYELSLTGVMELRPDQWGTTMRSHLEISWNYFLTNEAPPQNLRGITS